MNLGIILAIVAVWLWFCMVRFSEEGTPMSAAVFLPFYIPLVLALYALERSVKQITWGLTVFVRACADSERRIGQ